LVRASAVFGRGNSDISAIAGVLGLWLWFGQLLGAVAWLARLSGTAIKRRLTHPLAWHGILALTGGGVALLLARKIFAGGGVRQTYVGSLGPWVVPLCVALTASVAPWIAARLVGENSTRRTRWAIAGISAALSVAALVLDEHAPGGMLYFHALLLALGLAFAFQTIELIRLPPFVRYSALALSVLTLPSFVRFPSSRTARELLAQPVWAGTQLIAYAQFHVDFDHDGYSPLFGGGDCDDANPSVFIGAAELPQDGKDSDCDGFDDPKRSTLPFAPFRTEDNRLAQQIAERAKQFPTVVILVDALRFDRIGNPRFPNLAGLARDSIRFTRMYTTSASTISSVPALMRGTVRPAPGRENIAQVLAGIGQSTRFIAPDVIREHFHRLGQEDPLLSFSSRETIPTDHRTGWGAGDTVSTSHQITAAAIKALDSAQPPALLWLHYFDLHQWNVLESEGLPSRNDVQRYDAVLERVDASLRPLFEMRDHVNLVLLSDHGEGLGERGIRHHGTFIFQELAHIPLLVRVPGSEPATIDAPVTTPGVFNMLRALRGLATDVTADQSLLALVGATSIGEGPGFPGFESSQWSFLFGKHRLLYAPRQQLLELYDVQQDPLEQNNQADENPQLASELLARLFETHNEARR